MNQVEVEQKNYQMPPQDGFTIAHFLTVSDIERSARFYETVFGGRILSGGDSSGAPGYIQIANTWLIVNVGGGPTPDKPSVTLSVPADPDSVSSFMIIRVADIQASYELWRSRGAEFITEPMDKRGETCCYMRDPDGYILKLSRASRASLSSRGATHRSVGGDRIDASPPCIPYEGVSAIGRLANCRRLLLSLRTGSPTISIFATRGMSAASTISDSSRASIWPTHMWMPAPKAT
jgi:predicted enzyme related to lactoylglutathione lyase